MLLLFRLLRSKSPMAFLACILVGRILSYYLGFAFWVPFAEILVAYHLFLAGLLFGSDKESIKQTQSDVATVVIHVACVTSLVLAKLVMVILYAAFLQHVSPENVYTVSYLGSKFIVLVQYGLLYFVGSAEFNWLFQEKPTSSPIAAEADSESTQEAAASVNAPLVAATGADYYEWMEQVSKQSAYRVPVKSQQDAYEQWLRARGKTQFPAATGDPA